MIRLEDAVPAIALLLGATEHATPLVHFLRSEWRGKVVSRDHWAMLLAFVRKVSGPPAFIGYSAEDAWPSLIDEYVEHVKESAAAASS